MTEYTPRHSKAPRTSRGLRVGLIAVAATLAAGLLGGGTAYAVWNSHATVLGAEVGSGDLNVHHSAGTWSQQTPGVAEPQSGSLDTLSESFVAMPGDVIEMVVPFTTVLQGDNLSADLRVSMGAAMAGAQEAGVATASYRIETADGELVAPMSGAAALGESVTIDGLDGTAAGTVADWQVVVTVTIGGDYHWSGANDPKPWKLWGSDYIHITLDQVRAGGTAAETGAG